MSSEEILSQEEIDALLDKADSVAKKKIRDGLTDEVSSYDIFNPPAMKTSGLPDVEPLVDRLIERLPPSLEPPLSKICSVVSGPQPELMEYSEFRQTIESPTAMLSIALRHAQEGLLVTVCRNGAQSMVGALFGGSGKPTNRDYLSRTENRIAQKFLEKVMTVLGRSESAGTDGRFDFQTNPVALPGPSDETTLAVLRLNLAIGDGGGELCLAAAPEVFSDLLGKPADPGTSDESWKEQIAYATTEARVTLSARAAEVSLGIGDLLRVAPGDFIPVDIDQNVVLCANGQPLLRGLLGVSGSMNAVHILGPVAKPSNDIPRLEQRANPHE